MSITEAAFVMIEDCIANGTTDYEDIISELVDDELNEVVIEAVRLVKGGHHTHLLPEGV